MQKIDVAEVGDLLQQPWLATLATYRKNGQVLLSPVWFEWTGDAFLVSIVHGDAKELHLRRNPNASLVIAEEASYPGRVLEVSGTATVTPDANAEAITHIATRYLGEDLARRWVAQYPEIPWDLMRLVPERMRALDHRNVPMLREAQPQYPPTTEWKIEMVREQPGVRA
jgi:PPOX class probable F420-dependent enzyme